jgi:2-polyprenyl-3-methyl-5-hydroxy-6-metoxy-1,4-benzoquinol methylase
MDVTKDKAGEEYWSKVWEATTLPSPIDIETKSVNNYAVRRFDAYYKKLFSKTKTEGLELLEIGCGNSVWLPYFNSRFGFYVTGLDYSPVGCVTSRQILKREGVDGAVVCSDFANPPQEMIGKFDVVTSFGVAEHFTDTSDTIRQFAKFLKPGGMIITEIPNMTGIPGFMQRFFNKEVYDIHVPLTRIDLVKAHEEAGLIIEDSRYMISCSFHTNLEGIEKPINSYFLIKKFVYLLSILPKIIWKIEGALTSLPETQLFSPVIFVVGLKK